METLKYVMKKNALSDIKNNRVIQQYKQEINDFAAWAKKKYRIRTVDDIQKKGMSILELIQSYSNQLQKSGKSWKYKNGKGKTLSASTIHTYLAPIAKGLGVPMDEIKKPIRSADTITKTRDSRKNIRGKKDMMRPEAERIVQAQAKIGIRKSELIRLQGRDLTTDINGFQCIMVKKGKGGKKQLQRLLPEDVPFVASLFAGKDPNEKIFSDEEVKAVKRVDLHGMRAEHARKCYQFYLNEVEAGREDEIKRALIRTFCEYHKKDPKHPDRFERQIQKFLKEIESSNEKYILRGENRIRAQRAGKPFVYNRVALMATSVWHLSHWRNDVTVRHYML